MVEDTQSGFIEDCGHAEIKAVEKSEEYVARILSYVKHDPLAIQSATADKLKVLIQKSSFNKLSLRPTKKQWAPVEIVAHLSDAEIVAGFRIRKILAEPGTALPAFNQDAWANRLAYLKQDPYQVTEDFTVLRQINLRLLRSLMSDQWKLFGVHAERGRESIEHIIRLFAGHDLNHLKQLESLLS